MQEILVMTSVYARHTECRGGGGEARQPLGMQEFGQFSLEGNHMATRFFLAGIILVMSNGIKSRKGHERR